MRIGIYEIAFYLLALMSIASAAVIVISRNLIYSIFALLFTFFGVAGLYVHMGADFLAATQVLIYVGGILVLMLFGVMLTHKLYDLDLRVQIFQPIAGAIASILVFASLVLIALRAPWHRAGDRGLKPTTAEIGNLLLNDYLLPFEIASVLLLIALIGAVTILRRRRDL